MSMTSVYLALGSNQTCPRQQLLLAVHEISALVGVKVCDVSRVFLSEAMGPRQAHYYNIVLHCKVSVDAPKVFLRTLKVLEQRLGRQRASERWGPRCIDIDIIYWQGVSLVSPELTIPHIGCWYRLFVLLPWLDVAGHDGVLSARIRLAVINNRQKAYGPGQFLGALI